MERLRQTLIEADLMPLCEMSSEGRAELQAKVLRIINQVERQTGIPGPRYRGNLADFLQEARDYSQVLSSDVQTQNIQTLTKYLARQGVSCSRLPVDVAAQFPVPITDPLMALYSYFGYYPEPLDNQTIYDNLTPGERLRTGFTSPQPLNLTAIGRQVAERTVQERLFIRLFLSPFLTDCRVYIKNWP